MSKMIEISMPPVCGIGRRFATAVIRIGLSTRECLGMAAAAGQLPDANDPQSAVQTALPACQLRTFIHGD
jgi:hypothetical protein